MDVLIAYATTEGHTRKIADFLANELSEAGHEVVLQDVRELTHGIRIASFDKAIVAGSIHYGKHQKELDLHVFANKSDLNRIPTLLVSVSLAIVFPDTKSKAENYVRVFQESTGWQPSTCLLVAGATRHGAYEWFEEAMLMEGDLALHMQEELKGDREFTDWDELRKSVIDFVDNG